MYVHFSVGSMVHSFQSSKAAQGYMVSSNPDLIFFYTLGILVGCFIVIQI